MTAIEVERIAENPEPIVPGAPPPQPLWLDFWRGIADDNPVMIQMLGLCPTMAISNQVSNGLGMGAATIFVLVFSSLLISSLRKVIPTEVRLATYILIIATFVTISDLVMQAYTPLLSKTLGPFVPLIVVNCIILGRAEAFAGKVTVKRAVADAFGQGLGFMFALLIMCTVREVVGSGTFLGYHLFGPNYEPWVFMIMPPGGFLTMGLMFLTMGWWGERKKARLAGVRA
ncbi:MAG: electron transport complex subunit RsxE [Gemmatimonadaceae bacterium]